jgi:hypothetical protein
MHRLRFALSLLLPRSRAVNMPRTVSAFPSSTTSLAIPAFFPMIFRHGSSFSTTTSTNSTLPSFSEAQEVLNSQGSIRVRKALEVDGRLIFAGNQLAASKHFDSRICIPHKFCSRNGLDEVQAMDLSAALHRVSPPLPSHALHSILPLPSHAVHFFFINSMDAGILHIPLSKVPE